MYPIFRTEEQEHYYFMASKLIEKRDAIDFWSQFCLNRHLFSSFLPAELNKVKKIVVLENFYGISELTLEEYNKTLNDYLCDMVINVLRTVTDDFASSSRKLKKKYPQMKQAINDFATEYFNNLAVVQCSNNALVLHQFANIWIKKIEKRFASFRRVVSIIYTLPAY